MAQQVEKYREPTRILHWIHTGAFLILLITGFVLFFPPLGVLAQGGWTRIIHRAASLIFVIVPLIYLVTNFKGSMEGIGKAFSWGVKDLGWLKAAPAYYFLCKEEDMPPQDEMNSGQKLWWMIALVTGVLFTITGVIMWFLKTIAPAGLLQWMVLVHDLAFIAAGVMLFVHVYLGVFHPMMTEALGAIVHGKVSAEYAQSHHGEWYERVTKPQDIVEK